MRITLRFLGLDLLDLDISTADAEQTWVDEAGEATAYPMGFVACHEIPAEYPISDRDY